MALPVVSDITPSSGPSSGENLVVIEGANFRVYIPPAYGYVGEAAPVYVEVTFGGEVATEVLVEAEDRLVVRPPMYPGDPDLETFPPVDVTVQNLDDALTPIPGELATVVAGYTYARDPLRPPTLQLESPFVRIARQLLQLLKKQVSLLSTAKTHTDYSPDGIILAQAGVPSLHLVGPTITHDDYGWENPSIEDEQPDGSFLLWPNPIMHTLSFDLIGQSDYQIEFLTLMGLANKFLRRNPYLLLPGDVPANSRLRLPMVMVTPPETAAGIANSNLNSFTCSFEVRRVPVLYLPPHLASLPVDSLELQTQKFEGTLVEVKNL